MFGEVPNLCPRLHLPLQAGSDRVLARMNRKYDMARYMTLWASAPPAPMIALSTDLIVGFPGETEEQFQETLDAVRAVNFMSSFSFCYSDRPGNRRQPPPTRSNPPKSCVASNVCRLCRRLFPPTGSRPAWAVKRIFCLKGQPQTGRRRCRH